MKQILVIFIALLTAFIGTWTVKAHSPFNRPAAYADGSDYASGAWWLSNTDAVSSEWILDPEIPENYLPVPGGDELYMVIDNDGNIMMYRQRTLQDDGSWIWKDVNPDIPEEYEAVDGLDSVYRMTAADGSVSHFKYVRNEDDTFAFVPVDENGKELDSQADASAIPDNYRRVTGNIYAVLNEHGVVIGYKERQESNGLFIWVDCEQPVIKRNDTPSAPVVQPQATNTPDNSTATKSPQNNQVQIPGNSNAAGTVTQSGDGTYIQTETLITTETSGGWVTTYQTVITRTYNERGILLSTKKSEPVIISKVKSGGVDVNAPDPSKIAATLNEEYARVSVGLSFNTKLANEV